jgi:hypothetical protein
MIEIALWKRIEDIVPLGDLKKAKPSTLREIQPWLLGMPLGTGFPLNITSLELARSKLPLRAAICSMISLSSA